jgi:hypothetical protein
VGGKGGVAQTPVANSQFWLICNCDCSCLGRDAVYGTNTSPRKLVTSTKPNGVISYNTLLVMIVGVSIPCGSACKGKTADSNVHVV